MCINHDCPELCAAELETEDLAGGGVSTSWGTGSDVEDQALAARLVRLIDFYEDTIEELHAQGGGGAAAPPLTGSRERAQADLAALCRQVRELRRRSALATGAAEERLAGPLPRRTPHRRRRPGVPLRHRPRATGAAHHGRSMTVARRTTARADRRRRLTFAALSLTGIVPRPIL